MAKNKKHKWENPVLEKDPDPAEMELEDVDPEPEPENEDDQPPIDSDLRVIAAALAHKVGINAVAITAEQISVIQTAIEAMDCEISDDDLVECLKKAQLELLRRQLYGKE